MVNIISIMNQKGGVAKTTTSINLGSFLAMENKKVLLIDADAQGSLTKSFQIENTTQSINELFLNEKFDIISISENLDIIASDQKFIGCESRIINNLGRENILKKALNKIKGDYDYIIIDCPSNVSYITINALVSSDSVIIPVGANIMSLEGIDLMINFLTEIRDNLNDNLKLLGVLLTCLNPRLNSSKEVQDKIDENDWRGSFFKSVIRDNTAITNSQLRRQNIFEYDSKSNGAEDYKNLGEEILTLTK